VTPIETVEQLSAQWLTAALRSAGHDCQVDHVRATRVGTGQMGTSYRLDIHDRSGSGAVPATLIAKMGATEPEARQRVADGYKKEHLFYTQLVDTVDVNVPRCWFATISDDGTNFVLLLDDLNPAVPGVQANGCTAEQAAPCVANLAALHAPRWNDPTLREHPSMGAADPATGEFLQAILIDAVPPFVDRHRDYLVDEDSDTLNAAARSIAAWYVARTTPFSLTHGDYRLDNLMFAPDGTVTALDWQTASVGPPLRDVAYFISTSLEAVDRRQAEEDLLAGYLAGLASRGVTDYPADQCWTDYRLGHLQATLITVLGETYATGVRTEQSTAMFAAMARRSSAAIRDLGTLDLL